MSGDERQSMTELTRMAQLYEKRGRTKEAGELMQLVEQIQNRIDKEESQNTANEQSS
jgi:hypothetical protein